MARKPLHNLSVAIDITSPKRGLMKKIFACLLALFSFSIYAADVHTQELKSYESCGKDDSICLPAEKYTFVFAAEDGGVRINEYLREGETVENWRRMLTVRYYKNAKELKDAVNPYLDQIKPYRVVPVDAFKNKKSANKADLIFTTMLLDPKGEYTEIVVHRFIVTDKDEVRSAVISERVKGMDRDALKAAWGRRGAYMAALGTVDMAIY